MMPLANLIRGKVCLAAGIAVLVAMACLSPVAAPAQINVTTKTVNCDDDPNQPPTGDFRTLQQALNNTDWNGPIEIVVTGTCHGGITIGDGGFARNSVYIHPPDVGRAAITKVGTPAEGTGNVVQICGAHGILLERLDISGGNNGLFICDNSEVDFVDVTITNNTTKGVYVFGNSIAFFSAPSRISDNGAIGVDLDGQGANTLSFLGGPGPDGNVVERNGQFGINVGTLGVAHLQGVNVIRNNGGATTATTHGGIHATRTSAVRIQPSGNGTGTTEIASNVGPGILAEVNSSVSLQGANIHDNSGQGVYVRTQSVLELVGQDTFSANGIANISCDAWSLLTGDLTGITAIACKNLDVPPKK